MAYTKYFPAGSAMISATYLEAGDRVRLVQYSPVDPKDLDAWARESGKKMRLLNPVVGMTGTVFVYANESDNQSYFVIVWDKDRKTVRYNPFIREERGDIIELIEE